MQQGPRQTIARKEESMLAAQQVAHRSLACVWILTDRGLSCIWIEREAASMPVVREAQAQAETHRRVA